MLMTIVFVRRAVLRQFRLVFLAFRNMAGLNKDRCHTGEESFNRQFPECCCSRTLSQLRCVSATSARLGVSPLVATPALLWLLQYLPFVGEDHPFFFAKTLTLRGYPATTPAARLVHIWFCDTVQNKTKQEKQNNGKSYNARNLADTPMGTHNSLWRQYIGSFFL